ncbi:terminase [Clostridia bacterium]|nr:terminase [Clostridia bacterium]
MYKYTPTRFMLPTSHYDKSRADRAVGFIQQLRHTKGEWSGKPFLLLPWQESIIRDIFGTIKKDGWRQFNSAFITLPKKGGKSELAAAIALYMLCADGEAAAEVYGCANDRKQSAIVFDVARDMVLQAPAMMKRTKIIDSQKRILFKPSRSIYQAMSSEVVTKFGLNVSCCVFDELLGQADRKLYDVMTKGSGAARKQPLNFIITTAGNDQNTICYEVYQKAEDIIHGRKTDSSFYPVIFGADEGEDWTDPAVWRKANPSLGVTVSEDFLRQMCDSAIQNPAEENQFRQFFLNQWVKQSIRWMPMSAWDKCAFAVDEESLRGRVCYGGLDLSFTTDITAFVLVFPPADDDDKYIVLPYFWLPADAIPLRVSRDHVPYNLWAKQGVILTTEGDVIHYDFIEKFIENLSKKYNIREIAYDRWASAQMTQNLEGVGLTVVPFGQGFASIAAPTRDLMQLVQEGKLRHGRHPVLDWNIGNVVAETDAHLNVKMNKKKSTEKIDGAVALVMSLARAMIQSGGIESVYDTRGVLVI